jgi:hypothetical protein
MKKLLCILSITAAWSIGHGVLGVAATDAQGKNSGREHSEIWLAPQSLMPAPLAHDEDFMEMFTADAPWKFAAAHTQVFKLYTAFLVRSPQEQVNAVVADLNRRHIDIALENGVMNVGPANTNPPCGGLGIVEGYGTAAQAKRISEIVKAAGGTIRYIVMDEPLYYGHYSSKPHTCHSPISVVLDQIVPTLNTYRQEFPDIVIGEVEPTRFPAYANWQADLLTWAKGFNTATGRPLAFVQLDIPWSDDGGHVPGADRASKEPGDALEFYGYLQELQHQRLVGRIGIVHDGTPKDTTDAAWVEDAQNHLRVMEEKYGLRPEQDIFQSWMPRPTHALPESQPDTLTSLIDWYFSSHVAGLPQ